MARYVTGTSAQELERLAALPEIPEEPLRRERVEASPRERARTRAMVRPRQSISKFGVFGFLLVCVMLLMVVLSHMQLAMISHEMGLLERELGNLREEAIDLQMAHEGAFGYLELERFARDELGMVDAARGQIVFIGSSVGDGAEILRVETESSGSGLSFLHHLMGLFETLQEYLPFGN